MPENEKTPPGAPAAQDDLLGEAARNCGMPGGIASDRGSRRQAPRAEGDGEARPGQDENQAGFLKDSDKRFAP